MLCPNGYMDIGSKDRLALHVRTPPNLLFELVLVAGLIGLAKLPSFGRCSFVY